MKSKELLYTIMITTASLQLVWFGHYKGIRALYWLAGLFMIVNLYFAWSVRMTKRNRHAESYPSDES